MKILHVIDSMDMGGAQSLLVELVPAQKNFGHDVSVLQLKDSKDKTLIKKLVEQEVEVKALSDNRSVRNVINIISIIPFLSRYDIVHAHLFPANYWVAIAKFFSRSKTPIITTEHSTDNKRRKIRIFKYFDAFVYYRYLAVVACSDKAKETFRNRYGASINCLSIPNGVNINKFIEAKTYSKSVLLNVSEDIFVTTMVARFIPSKRQDVIVRAIALLPHNHHAVFVGGQEGDVGVLKVKELARRLNVLNRIHFLYLRSDVPSILKSSDVVVMSSEYEGLSLSSIEGMACGHPFIASDVNGLKEVVQDAGILVKCGDYKELAFVIRKLEKDKAYREEVVNRCLKRASSYDISLVAKRYCDLYNQFC